MAKRKRGSAATGTKPASDDSRPGNSKLAINTYEDVADSEDEFHLGRDQVLLDAPEAKRKKRLEDDVMQASDEEVLAYSDSQNEDEDELDGEDEDLSEDSSHPSADEDQDAEAQSEDDEEAGALSGWGTSKKDYYNADEIETEEQARQEEEEARRLQKERRKALSEADFAFDEDRWQGQDSALGESKDGVFTETLPPMDVTSDMSLSEKMKLFKSLYPEFEPLSKEMLDLQPVFQKLSANLPQDQPKHKPSLHTLQFRALSAYLGCLAMYFAVLTSGEPLANGKRQPLAPHLLREHEVMDFLIQCRERWNKVKDVTIQTVTQKPRQHMVTTDDDSEEESTLTEQKRLKSDLKKATKAEKAALMQASQARRAARQQQTEQQLADLNRELDAASSQRLKPSKSNVLAADAAAADADSDLGDEEELDPHEAAEKARKRKSLRFYTSQIAQKANKRANAARATGGDDDLPHRERLRDRQERLTREAQKRGQKAKDEDLGAGSEDEGPSNMQREERGGNIEDDEFAREMIAKAKSKKAFKNEREEAYRQAKEQGGKVVRQELPGVGPDGRREIGFKIEKNKGLTPKRNKLNKNPRAKKRAKYEEKTKKLRSMKPTYKGGEGRGGYGGELTGIKTNLVRSTKL